MATLYRLVERPPDIEEYRSLCHGVNWDGVINFAAEGTLSFYERYGFAVRPGMTGMFLVAPG